MDRREREEPQVCLYTRLKSLREQILLREEAVLMSLVQKQLTSLGGGLCQNSWLPDSHTRQAIRTHESPFYKGGGLLGC